MPTESKKDFLINTAYFLTVLVAIVVGVKFLFGYFLPFIIAFVIAYFVQKPALKLSEKTVLKHHILSAVLAAGIFILLLLILVLLVWVIIKNSNFLLHGFGKLFKNVSEITLRLRQTIAEKFSKSYPQLEDMMNELTEGFSQNITDRIASFLSLFAETAIKKVPNFLFGSLVTLVATFYIAKDFEILKKFYINFFGTKLYKNTRKIKEILISSVFKMAKGYLILLLITFAELLVGFFILNIENAFFLALLVSFVDLLPIFGTGTVLIPFAIVQILSGKTVGFGIIVLYIIITVVRNFAEPKVIGQQIGINPLFTLLAMFLGLKLFGFFGIILLPVILIVTIKYYKETA